MFLARQNLLSLSILLTIIISFRVARCSQQCKRVFSTLHCNGQTRNISTFPSESTLQGYVTLLVTFTNISSLQNGLVILPPLPQLETLVLSSNGILVLNDSLVENNQQIKGLQLQHNKLSSVPIKVLENLPNLTYLDLSYNNILTIPENAFHTNHNLEILLVNGNDLNQVHPDALNGVFSLKYIHLSSNILNRFSFEIFQRVPELTNLFGIYLEDSGITKLSNVSVEVTSCQTLNLNGNLLQSLKGFTLSGFTGLKLLFLDRNQISVIDRFVFGFEDHYNLTVLLLARNNIHRVPVSFLRQLPRLVTLSLAQNKLTQLPNGAFRYNINVEVIDLSDNQIHTVHGLSFIGIQNLRDVDLTVNKPSSLPEQLFDVMDPFVLDIAFNNWTCNCNLFDFLTWSSSGFIRPVKVCVDPRYGNQSTMLLFLSIFSANRDYHGNQS
ncbi:hypothetical protein BSL78_07598 [Apostichopus japonicus]|uniref:Uncharacterized protein n=1 Tax=Stichopus japonicus TaxID=307972 RepID=A0A2G8L5I0_STIJA|nr:hypothetical protein BSL78_07598 [Apostichopus japonicus]